MERGSVSKIRVVLEIQNKSKLSCELKRHLSPKIVGIISRNLPIKGNAHLLGNITYLSTSIDCGVERPKKEFKKGDIAFLPTNGSICFVMSDTLTNTNMSPIGKIISNVDDLKNVKTGDVFTLYAETV